ncbi:MAG: Gfo/Idh/MocA family oxidoreductase [bacterium]
MADELRFAIIGTGNIGPFHADAISKIDGAKLVAVADIVEEKAKQLADKYNADAYTDYERMLERDDIDVVNICTPSGLHMESALKAAEKGKHLIVEKPLDITLEKCDRIIDACRKNNLKLCVIFPTRFKPAIVKTKEAIEQGRFGKIVLVDGTLKCFRSQEYYDSGQWRGTWELDGGGALMNQSIHTIDALYYLTGDVSSINAYTGTLARKVEVEDTAVAIIKFKNSALGVIEGASCIYPGYDPVISIHGEKGSVVINGEKIEKWDFETQQEQDTQIKNIGKGKTSTSANDPTKQLSSEGHMCQIADMVEAIRTDREPKINGEEGRKAVEIIIGIYRSQREKREITLPI